MASNTIPSNIVFFHQNRHNFTVKQVRERSMAEVMHQSGNSHIAHIFIRNVVVLKVLREAFVLLTDISQAYHLFLSQMTDAETMCKSSVSRPWEHIVQAAKLVEAFKPRIDWVVYILPNISRKAYELVVHAVLDTSVVRTIIKGRLHSSEIGVLRQRS